LSKGKGRTLAAKGRIRLLNKGGNLVEKEIKKFCLPCEINVGEEREMDCISFQDYLMAEEEEALSMFRKLKEESRKIRDKIQALEEDLKLRPQNQSQSAFHKAQEGLHRELWVCYEELEKLRNVWKEQEARREKANRRKMILLGYSLPF
jgi:uncharacterized protein (DUF342 family)